MYLCYCTLGNSYFTMPNSNKYQRPAASLQYTRVPGNGFTKGLRHCCSDVQGCNRSRRSARDCSRIWYASCTLFSSWSVGRKISDTKMSDNVCAFQMFLVIVIGKVFELVVSGLIWALLFDMVMSYRMIMHRLVLLLHSIAAIVTSHVM